MPDRIKQISIAGAGGNDTRDIGAEAQYVEVSYDSQGHIIKDITVPGVVVDHTGPLTDVLGQVNPGVGLEINPSTGLLDVKYGTTAGTAAQGNDSRLSDDRKNPNAVTFSDGAATPTTETYDGSVAKTVTYATVGAAPKEHASATAEYGAASKSNFGHVKIGNGINVSAGVISVDSSGDHITLTKAEYDALTPQEKADPDKYYFISDVEPEGIQIDSVMSASSENPVQNRVITNALNEKEDAALVLTSTLAVGATSVVFTNAAIGNNSLIDVYTDASGVNPTAISQSGTSVTLTFDAQSSAVSVKILVRN